QKAPSGAARAVSGGANNSERSSTRLNEKAHAAPDGGWGHFGFGCYKHFTSNEVRGTTLMKLGAWVLVSVPSVVYLSVVSVTLRTEKESSPEKTRFSVRPSGLIHLVG